MILRRYAGTKRGARSCIHAYNSYPRLLAGRGVVVRTELRGRRNGDARAASNPAVRAHDSADADNTAGADASGSAHHAGNAHDAAGPARADDVTSRHSEPNVGHFEMTSITRSLYERLEV